MAQGRGSREEEMEFEKLVQDYIHDAHYATAAQAACNVVYAIANAGIVLLPFAACASGIGVFTVSVAAACLVSGYTSVMLVKMANDRGVKSYDSLGELAFGSAGFYIVAILQLLFSSLVAVMCVNLRQYIYVYIYYILLLLTIL